MPGIVEPAHLRRRAVARHDAPGRGQVGIVLVVLVARAQPPVVGDQRHDREHQVLAGHAPVVAEAGVGGVEPLLAHQPALAVEHVEVGVGGRLAAGEHAVAPPFAGPRIDLGMRGQRGAAERAEPPDLDRLERLGIDPVGARILAQHVELAVVVEGVGVAGVVALREVGDALVVGVLVAVVAVEPPPRLALALQALGLDDSGCGS